MLPETDQAGAEPEVEEIDAPETEVEGVDLDIPEEAEEGKEAEPAKAEPEPPDDTEEIEHDGKKHRIPKALKGAFLMQSDYTRKTQEVAEQRRQHAETVKAYQERQKIDAEVVTENARVVALNDTIAQYENVNWADVRAKDPKAYDEHWFNYQQVVRQRDAAQKTLDQKILERSSKANADAQAQFEKFRTDALAAVPEIAQPDYLGKLNTYAVSLGFSPQELAAVRDPRILVALNAAYSGQLAQAAAAEAAAKAKVTQAAVAKATTAKVAKPLPTVKGNAPTPISPSDPASDKLSAEEWMRRRNEQTRRQGRR